MRDNPSAVIARAGWRMDDVAILRPLTLRTQLEDLSYHVDGRVPVPMAWIGQGYLVLAPPADYTPGELLAAAGSGLPEVPSDIQELGDPATLLGYIRVGQAGVAEDVLLESGLGVAVDADDAIRYSIASLLHALRYEGALAPGTSVRWAAHSAPGSISSQSFERVLGVAGDMI